MPVIDLQTYFQEEETSDKVQTLCKQVAQCFHDYGILIIRDPRAQEAENSQYIDLMEKYFESRGEMFYAGQEIADVKPEYHF